MKTTLLLFCLSLIVSCKTPEQSGNVQESVNHATDAARVQLGYPFAQRVTPAIKDLKASLGDLFQSVSDTSDRVEFKVQLHPKKAGVKCKQSGFDQYPPMVHLAFSEAANGTTELTVFGDSYVFYKHPISKDLEECNKMGTLSNSDASGSNECFQIKGIDAAGFGFTFLIDAFPDYDDDSWAFSVLQKQDFAGHKSISEVGIIYDEEDSDNGCSVHREKSL